MSIYNYTSPSSSLLNETPNVRKEALRQLRRKTEATLFDERADEMFRLKLDIGRKFRCL